MFSFKKISDFFSAKDQSTSGLKSQSKKRTFQETFILESTLNPSAIIDVGDESPDPIIIDPDLPDEIESEVDIEDETTSEKDLTPVEDSIPDEVEEEILFITDPKELDVEDNDIEDNPEASKEKLVELDEDIVSGTETSSELSEDSKTEITESESDTKSAIDEDIEVDSEALSEEGETVSNNEENSENSTLEGETVSEIEETSPESNLPEESELEETETTTKDSSDESTEEAELSSNSETEESNPSDTLNQNETVSNNEENSEVSNLGEETVPEAEETLPESNLPEESELEETETTAEEPLDESTEEAESSSNSETEESNPSDTLNQNETEKDSNNETDIVEQIASSTIDFNFDSGIFTVGETGEIGIDYLFDGGKFNQGEVAIFSLEGMEESELSLEEFIKEAAKRALSDSELGHVVISDANEGARFNGELGEKDFNQGDHLGIKTFKMNPGDQFAIMFVPNGKIQDVFDNPSLEGRNQPLFSLATANPDDGFQLGQIADITGDGNTFVFEDLRVDENSDRDYNDMMFQVRGATGEAVNLDEVISDQKDWRSDDLGQALIEYAKPYITPEEPIVDIENSLSDLLTEVGDLLNDGESETEIESDQELSDSEVTENEVIDETEVFEEESPDEVAELVESTEPDIEESVVIEVEDSENTPIVEESVVIEVEDSENTPIVEESSLELEDPVVEENLPTVAVEETTESVVIEIEDNLDDPIIEESVVIEIEDDLETSTIEETDSSVVIEAEDNSDSSASITEPIVIDSSSENITVEETDELEVVEIADNSQNPVVEEAEELKVIETKDSSETLDTAETESNSETPIAVESQLELEETESQATSQISSVEEIEQSESVEFEDNSELSKSEIEETDETELIAIDNYSETPPISTVESPTVNLVDRLENLTYNLQNQTLSETPVNSNLVQQLEQLTNRLTSLGETSLNSDIPSETLALIEQLETQLVTQPVSPTTIEPPVDFEFATENQPLIGIIDTGFSGDNPDIDYSRITWGQDHIDGDSDPTLTAGEGNEHGTHILGLIAAEQDNDIGIDGINNNAPIWAGRAIGSGKWAESLIEFVDATIESQQPNAVVNLSLDLTQIDAEGNVTTRYEFTPTERAAIEYARQNNVLLVTAAGNDGGVMSALGQSSQEFDNIITVGAAQQFNPDTSVWKGAERADYSSYGYGLDVMASGGTTELPELSTSGDGVGTMAGTSVATAKVTGAISQVWAANPELSYRQVIEMVKNTATDLGETGFDLETGAGLLNIAAAVQLAKVTTGEEHYAPSSWIPDSWSGEGIVTPGERAVTFTHPIVDESFSGWVMPDIGVDLRNSNQYEDRSSLAEPYGKTLSFDAWTYGERVSDYQLDTPDELWYRLSGTNYWVPSAYIYGFPGSRPPVLAPQQPQPQPQPQPQSSYYPDLASLSNDQWNEYTKDNTRFDVGWPDFLDERHLTPESIQDIYTDLSNEIFDTRYPMTAGYLLDPGYRNGIGIWHSGIDLAAPQGSAVQVPVGGTIVRNIQEIGGNYFIGVQGDDGKLWIYGHLGTVAVQSGRIEAGQVLGTIGSQAHLHLEVQQGPNYRSSQNADLNTVQNATLNPIKSFWELRNENATSSPTNPENSVETFTGEVIATVGANVRSGPGTSYEDVGDRPYEDVISFDGVTTGEFISYPELGTATDQWYRIAGTNEWISAAIIEGSPQSSVNNSVARPGEQQQYIIKANDTLWGIAQRYLGDGNRWQEIMKTPEGGTFTEAEALNLQEGQSVYLPVIYQTGTGQPVTAPPSSDGDSGDEVIGSVTIDTTPVIYDGRKVVDDSGWKELQEKRDDDFEDNNNPNLIEKSVLGNIYLAHLALKKAWDIAGYDDAAELLGYYLNSSNNGGPFKLNLDEAIRESKEMAQELMEDFSLNDILEPIRQGFKTGLIGNGWDSKGRGTADNFDLSPNVNWLQALGGFHRRYEGKFTLEGDTVKLSMRFFIKDVYDFDGFLYGLTGSHELHKAGLARVFVTTGESSEYTWKFSTSGIVLEEPKEFASVSLKDAFTLVP
jgi:murein DD-endopeptidase MepM/ murein hydrolase activator NlpD